MSARARGGGLAAALVAVAVAFTAPVAHAGDFDVNTTKDKLDANPGDGICAAANGKCALRAAVQEANALPGVDNVSLPKGTFELTRPRSDTAGIEEGDLDLTEAVAIVGKSRKKTIIKQTERDRVIRSDATPALIPGAILAGLTVTGGDLREEVHGGGILVEDHSLLIQDAMVRGNTFTMKSNTVGLGGGIAALEGSDLTLNHTTVTKNRAIGDFSTASAAGGGLMLHFLASATLTDSRITNNVARTNGFVGTRGGGAYLQGPTTISGTRISGNRADAGGGIWANSYAGIQATSTTVSGNSAKQGAGLGVDSTIGVEFTNSTFSHNKLLPDEADPGTGAAVFMDHGFIRFIHVTVADHVLGQGQATFALEDAPPTGMGVNAEIRKSVFDNPRDECSGEDLIGTFETNVVEDDSCTGGGLSSNLVGDPKLKPLKKNPGPGPGAITKTHALKGSSPAIDFITTGCPPPAADQVGHIRPQGEGFCDAGSFEAPG